MNNPIFIADLHLSANTPSLNQQFFDLLNNSHASAIYLLGDIFEYWIGGDDQPKFHQEICAALKKASLKTKLFFMPGNRDFLVPPKWAKNCGMTFLKDPTVMTIFGQRILLSHGDIFCTKDTLHMRFRKITQNTFFQKFFLAMPYWLRKKLAEKTRASSTKKNHSPRKFSDELSVQHHTVEKYIKRYKAKYLIHGHTHLPQIYHQENYTRAVLPDWDKHPSGYLEITPQCTLLLHLPFLPKNDKI